MTRYVFTTGGVVSSLGKGLASASLGALLQARGYKVKLRKLDPYLNVDPGTMNPTEHGEVFVLNDGSEVDLDLGHYERFTGVDACKHDSISAGRIYLQLLQKERRGDYLGSTVQVIPHVTDLIKEFITSKEANEDYDFVLCEIGGTVGDIEGLPFFEAIRQIGYELGQDRVVFVHLTLVPYIPSAKELKTKPTQHSVKELRSIGIQPDILLCRADREIPEAEKKKIALFCNLRESAVIPALDVKTIYGVPLSLHTHGFDSEVLKAFGMESATKPDLQIWHKIVDTINNASKEVKVGIVGKYVKLADADKSLTESLTHAGIANHTKVQLKWINSRTLTEKNAQEKLNDVDAILIPGGFGKDGTDGKIIAINYARVHKIPFLGICFGMQLAIIEIARNLCKLADASSTEFGECEHNVVGLMAEWQKGEEIEKRNENTDLGGTMRLGSYDCVITKGSLAEKIYNSNFISERHRHRYEVNLEYRKILEDNKVVFSGFSPDGTLPEIIELGDHPWFVAVQFHPEFKSRPFAPHPLFVKFVEAALLTE